MPTDMTELEAREDGVEELEDELELAGVIVDVGVISPPLFNDFLKIQQVRIRGVQNRRSNLQRDMV